MMMKRWLRAAFARGEPVPPRLQRVGRTLALVVLALGALALEGCRSCGSDPCSPTLLQRVFPRRLGTSGCSTCGNSFVEGVPIEAAPAVVTPAVPAIPAFPSSPGVSSDVPELLPVEPAPALPSDAGVFNQRSRSLTSPANYQTYHYQGSSTSRREAAGSLARANPRSEPARSPRTPASAGDLLSTIPPPAWEVLDRAETSDTPPPSTLSQPAEIPPGALTPTPTPAPEPTPEPEAAATPEPAPAELGAVLFLPRSIGGPAPAQDQPPAPAAPVLSMTPGIRRFKSVEAGVAGGSFPSPAGLRWLAEKGYRTILDLRSPEEVRPADIATIDHLGLRRIDLPISTATLDARHVERFTEELAQGSARPLYFCDTDGSRASVLWYIRLIRENRINAQQAASEVKDLGPSDPTLFAAADSLLSTQPIGSPPAEPVAQPAPPPADSATAPPAATAEPTPTPIQVEVGEPTAPQPIPEAARNNLTVTWRPYAALLLTLLGVPVAYWSRTGLPFKVRRASLPAPARTPQALPGGSDD